MKRQEGRAQLRASTSRHYDANQFTINNANAQRLATANSACQPRKIWQHVAGCIGNAHRFRDQLGHKRPSLRRLADRILPRFWLNARQLCPSPLLMRLPLPAQVTDGRQCSCPLQGLARTNRTNSSALAQPAQGRASARHRARRQQPNQARLSVRQPAQDRVQGNTNATADQCSIKTDILQITSNAPFDFVDQVSLVPVRDRIRDVAQRRAA